MDSFEGNSLSQFSRRSFIKVFAFGVATAGSGVILATLQGCFKNDNGPTAPSLTGQKVTLTLASESALQNIRGSIRRSFGSNANGGKEVIVMRLAQSGQNAFATASVVCTHQGCSVNNPSSGTINCPCHGSVFGAQSSNFAQNLSGPAPSPLPTFATTFDGTTIIITF
jgi:Rieske Fe-S protein